jgi:hypothetical protein
MLMLQQWQEVNRIRDGKIIFLIKKLGLSDGANLDAGIDAVIENMGDLIKVNTVVYYLLAVHFKKRVYITNRFL